MKSAPPVLSFETAADVQGIKVSAATVRRVARHATEGRYALEARFDAVEQAWLEIPIPTGDWRGYGSVGLDAANVSGETVLFSMEVRDQAGARVVGRTGWVFAPREQASFVLSLMGPAPMAMGMQGEPPIGGFELKTADTPPPVYNLLRSPDSGPPLDLSKIAVVGISMRNLLKPRTVVVDNFRLGFAVSYEKIVDRFGQYARADWPGKAKSEADLKAQWAAEQAELKARPALPERDEYGGWAAGPKLEATGYFRAVKRNGKWWLVTPNGHLFFSVGPDSVNATEGGTLVGGREQMFEWLPGEGDPLAVHFQAPRGRAPAAAAAKQQPRRAFSFLTANLERKYGPDWYARWQEVTMARLPAWGFNTIANWSDTRLGDLKKIPYTATLRLARGEMAQLSHTPPFPNFQMPDTFDPRFAAAVDQSLRGQAEQRRHDPWLLGYYVDNELPWGFMRNDRTRYALGLDALSLGAASPAKLGMADQLRARYGTIEKLNAAWNARLASWEELLEKPFRPEGQFPPAMREDLAAFVRELARRYFRTVRDALRKYDSNHLYLGMRFAWLVREEYAWTTQEVEEAAAEYCDVISFNIYLPRLDARWDSLKRLGKPAIIGEFNMGALDRGMFYPGVVAARSQADRARMYQEYVRSVADHPAFVGCHWFKYGDEPLTGRGDGENFNTGFTTVTDSVYPEMVAAAKAVHAEIYRRHSRRP
jgi:hypothetical protein